MDIKFEPFDAGTRAALSGKLDESFDPASLTAKLPGRLAIDLDGVVRINSVGIKLWVRFARDVPAGSKVTLERCPIHFVQQANLITNLLGACCVESLYLPYLCPQCETDAQVLVTASSLASGEPPAPTCASCGALAEADFDADSYLGFLAPGRPCAPAP